MIRKPSLLMGLYGHIEYDGRVQRTLVALKQDFDISLFTLYENEKFGIEGINIIKWKPQVLSSVPYLRLWYFIYLFLFRAIRKKPDIVYLHDYYLAIIVLILKVVSSAKLIYDAHEIIIPMKDERIGARKKLFYQLEKRSIASFNLVIAANYQRGKIMQDHYKLQMLPLVILNIPNLSDRLISDISNLKSKYPQLNILDNSLFTFVYQGAITSIRKLEKIFSVIVEIPNSQLVIIGGGEAEYIKLLNNYFLELGYDRVTFLGKIAPDDMYGIMQYCDFGIISYSMDDYNNLYCAPNKIYEYAAFGLPMITSNHTLFKEIFREYRIGVAVEVEQDNNVSEYFSSIMAIKKEEKSFLSFSRFLSDNNFEDVRAKLLSAVKNLS